HSRVDTESEPGQVAGAFIVISHHQPVEWPDAEEAALGRRRWGRWRGLGDLGRRCRCGRRWWRRWLLKDDLDPPVLRFADALWRLNGKVRLAEGLAGDGIGRHAQAYEFVADCLLAPLRECLVGCRIP